MFWLTNIDWHLSVSQSGERVGRWDTRSVSERCPLCSHAAGGRSPAHQELEVWHAMCCFIVDLIRIEINNMPAHVQAFSQLMWFSSSKQERIHVNTSLFPLCQLDRFFVLLHLPYPSTSLALFCVSLPSTLLCFQAAVTGAGQYGRWAECGAASSAFSDQPDEGRKRSNHCWDRSTGNLPG